MTDQTQPGMHQALCQPWVERERGWTGGRPDGYSLHLSQTRLDAYVQAYWDSMPDQAPDEYSAPAGDTYIIDVDAVTYAELQVVRGIRRHQPRLPERAHVEG